MSYFGQPTQSEPVQLESFGDSARPTSIDIEICGKGSFSVQASHTFYTEDKQQAVVKNVFETVPILVTDAVVRHYKFRCPKSTDFGEHARWSIAVTGDVRVSAVGRFSRRTPIVWQQPKPFAPSTEKKKDVTEELLSRNWRYANTVA